MLKVKKIPLGLYQTNCYILTDTVTKQTAVIDPGVWNEELNNALSSSDIGEIKYVLLTHGHFDHICGVYHIKEKFNAKVYISFEEDFCLYDTMYSLTDSVEGYTQIPCKADGVFKEGDEFYLGDNKIIVKETPGHTKGSVIFITDEFIFSGDTLFRCSMGRTDLPSGSTKQLFKSLREIGQMQGEYIIYPGHNEETTLTYEKQNNRYLRAR